MEMFCVYTFGIMDSFFKQDYIILTGRRVVWVFIFGIKNVCENELHLYKSKHRIVLSDRLIKWVVLVSWLQYICITVSMQNDR